MLPLECSHQNFQGRANKIVILPNGRRHDFLVHKLRSIPCDVDRKVERQVLFRLASICIHKEMIGSPRLLKVFWGVIIMHSDPRYKLTISEVQMVLALIPCMTRFGSRL